MTRAARFGLRILGCVALTVPLSVEAQLPTNITVVTAATTSGVPRITLRWITPTGNPAFDIYRKTMSDGLTVGTPWVQIATGVSSAQSNYADSTVSAGQGYEYKIDTHGSYDRYQYVESGVDVPMVETRGTVVLVVDNTHTAALSNELSRLTQDFIGDGWQVIRHDVAPASASASIKATIQADYNANPSNVKAVFLFGHLPMVMSGYYARDGHASRAHPADAYYGDMNGAWTDTSMNYPGANVPGDGIFDQNTIPSTNMALQVARVDLNNLTLFSKTEEELLRQYLDKNHRFRNRQFDIQQRAFIQDALGYDYYGHWPCYVAVFGPSNVETTAWKSWRDPAYAFGTGWGSGSAQGPSQAITTTDLSQGCDQTTFGTISCSYIDNWEQANSVIRGLGATLNYGLGCLCEGSFEGAKGDFHRMAMGEEIGASLLWVQRMNPGNAYVSDTLQGDPTLRLQYVAPATGLSAVNTSGTVALAWATSRDAVLGYHVYRATSMTGAFMRLTSNWVQNLSYQDTNPPASCVYMVRAVAETTNASGSYFNPGQGAFVTYDGVGAPPGAASGVSASHGTLANEVHVNWNAVPGAARYEVWRARTETETAWAKAMNTVGTTNYDDTLAEQGTPYYYRVRGANDYGVGAFSPSDGGWWSSGVLWRRYSGASRPPGRTPTGCSGPIRWAARIGRCGGATRRTSPRRS